MCATPGPHLAGSEPCHGAGPVGDPFEALSLAQLRGRTSIKWRLHDPDVLPLWVAEMDTLPAPEVVAAVCSAMKAGDTGYPGSAPTYARALASFAARHWDWSFDPGDTAMVADVMTGMTQLVLAVTDPGDSVLIPTPIYPPLLSFTAEIGRRVASVPLTADHRLDLAGLAEAAAKSGARALLLCSPHNPTGTVHSAGELAALDQLCAAHGITVLADEIHAPLVPEGATFTPWLAVSSRGFVVTSASKAYNLAGMKAAIIVAGPQSQGDLDRLPHSVRYGASHLGVLAHTTAWQEGDGWLAAVNRNIAGNRRHLAELLATQLPSVRYQPSAATYLAWLDCRGMGLDEDPAKVFLRTGRVALNAGPTFGKGGHGHVRLNLATSRAILTEAVRRMASSLSG